jgi:hypothetical protein
VEVMIVVPLVAPDVPVGVRALEECVAEWGRLVMRQAMATVGQAIAARQAQEAAAASTPPATAPEPRRRARSHRGGVGRRLGP